MINANNSDVAGGGIIGFSAAEPWAGNSQNPRAVTDGLSSTSVFSQGGAVEFRGADDSTQRFVGRDIDAYTGPATTYFSGSLSASPLDDSATSLIAFSSVADGTRASNFLNNSGDFYNGFAFGFDGDGSGGMDLVVRYRNSDLNYVQGTLLSGLSADTVYTVSGKITWNVEGTLGDSREELSLWVNPDSASEPGTADFSTIAFAGDPSALD